jgi:hypothetical protein
MTPSALMTDEVWIKIAPVLAKGIRNMLVSIVIFMSITIQFYCFFVLL